MHYMLYHLSFGAPIVTLHYIAETFQLDGYVCWEHLYIHRCINRAKPVNNWSSSHYQKSTIYDQR